MPHGLDATGGQEIGWNGLFLKLPASWEPTVIYPDYLFFEDQGRAVFEIKWQQIRGRYSSDKSLQQLRKTLKDSGSLHIVNVPSAFHHFLHPRTVSGFELRHGKRKNSGVIIHCPACNRVTLMQWYFDTDDNTQLLENIVTSFADHPEDEQQLWAMYGIRALLPREAGLKSHEFLPGRYIICFDLNGLMLTLYRFKPAAIILQNKSIGVFGTNLVAHEPLEEGNGWASWSHKAAGVDLLLAKLRKKPVVQWMRLWHVHEQNVILGVRAECRRMVATSFLNNICEHYSSI